MSQKQFSNTFQLRLPQRARAKTQQSEHSDFRTLTILPDWLTIRKDFQRMRRKVKIQLFMNVPNICKKHIKSAQDIQYLIDWEHEHNTFKGYPKYLKEQLLLKLQVANQKKNFELHKYILYHGTQSNIGQQIFKEDTHKDNITLVLHHHDLKEVMVVYKRTIIEELHQLLQQTIIFINLHGYRIFRIQDAGYLHEYFTGEPIDAECLSVIIHGQVRVEKYQQIQQTNKWPCGFQEWEIRQVQRMKKQVYYLDKLKYFGLNQPNVKYFAQENCVIFQIQLVHLQQIIKSSNIEYISKMIFEQFDNAPKKTIQKRYIRDEVNKKKFQLEHSFISLYESML
ncbi:hypothetical protein pb186bvf_010863 [Paramecium bursaria]